MQVGPFEVTGNLHRSPSAAPMASLSRWVRFVPVTDAEFHVVGRDATPTRRDVVLVNRERISRTKPLVAVPIHTEDPRPEEPAG